MRAFSRLDASAVMVNNHTAFRVDGMPFAGLRQSGLGIGGIPYTMEKPRKPTDVSYDVLLAADR
jgi:acyl-CoA reductase-like NAD-dependent aldehyde dehydrogenase